MYIFDFNFLPAFQLNTTVLLEKTFDCFSKQNVSFLTAHGDRLDYPHIIRLSVKIVKFSGLITIDIYKYG